MNVLPAGCFIADSLVTPLIPQSSSLHLCIHWHHTLCVPVLASHLRLILGTLVEPFNPVLVHL
jgi:hypothetical protein